MMTEDVSDVTSPPSNVLSSEKTLEHNVNSDSFRKPLSINKAQKVKKHLATSSNNVDATRSELKKKKKGNGSKSSSKKKSEKVASKESSTNSNKGETEDAAESVDSGCIADIAGDITDWPQVESVVLEERNYVLGLLSWLPDFQWVLPKEKPNKPNSTSSQGAAKKDDKKKKRDKTDPFGTKAKLREFLNEADEIDHLHERYTELLTELKRGRKDKVSQKKEDKLKKKLKNLQRRNKKNTNRQRKLEQAEIFKEKHKEIETKKKVGTQKKIFNEKGKLVFSKFDFSSDGSSSKSTKAKNLELRVAQAIKEKEMRKKLKEAGDFKGAAEFAEVSAWSSALQRAEGRKVRDNIDLLQKSLKKKEHRKKMSKKRWEERGAALEKKMKDRQTKRNDNLETRRKSKSEKKLKKLKTKGHIVPGF